MSNTIDQQFIEYIVKSLVSKPDEVKIERRIDEKGVLLELTVDPEDLGRVIGKRGATAQSLRTLLRALGTKQDARYNLKIIDPSGGFNGRSNSDDREDRSDRPEKNERSDKKISGESEQDIQVDKDVDTIVGAFTDDEEVEKEETAHSDRISKAREELADLDDLDV
jgi:predicted RNA-binding protein YlqC (UPF0109 family)